MGGRWGRPGLPPELVNAVRRSGGARVLGWSRLPADGWAVATADELLVRAVDAGSDNGPLRIPWYLVSSASWDDGLLDVMFAPAEGARSETIRLPIDEDGRLAEAVRTLVTGAIAWTGRVVEAPVGAATFSARRRPDGQLLWSVRFDPGYDPGRGELRDWADAQIARLRGLTGL